MGRRPRTARFMPGVYVFPGGATEPDDRQVTPASGLTPEVTPLLKVGGSAARARAMAITAVRETFEETGLMLAAPGETGLAAHPVWARWEAAGLAPALGRMDLTARAITPPRSPIRFHARFFLADDACITGSIGGDGELEDISWVALAETEDMPLADIQRFLVDHLRRVLHDTAGRRPRPVFTHRRGRRHVRYE